MNEEVRGSNEEVRARATARRAAWIAFFILHSNLFILLAGCSGEAKDTPAAGGGQGGGQRRPSEFPVEARPVESRRVEYTVNAVGSLEAFESVAVTARVAGAIERVLFSEGQFVTAGTTLVEIEPERYRLAVAAAEATQQREIAEKGEAEAGFARRQAANAKNPGLVRAEEVETWRTRVQTAAAEVTQAQAAVAQARLNLRDAFVRAPVPGIIQTRTVQTGQYVQPGSVLATLVRRDPLLLRFQVPEQDAAPLRTGMTVNFSIGESTTPFDARVTHVAAAASSQSRMVDVTAHVVNPNRPELRPGAFARVTVPVGAPRDAPVIPQTAIRPSERGFLAFIVKDGAAEQRVLTLGMRTADGQVEVRQGLTAGEILVVRGAEALRDGAKVKVQK
jgi:membrane fusion protein, multidrug efflux system